MAISFTQTASIAVQSAAFVALDYSDTLNNLVAKITSCQNPRSTLAENILNQAAALGLEMAGSDKGVDGLATAYLGISGAEFAASAKNVFISKDEGLFSASVHRLTQCAIKGNTENGTLPTSMKESVPEFAAQLAKDYVGTRGVQQLLGLYIQEYGWDEIQNKIEVAVGRKDEPGLVNYLVNAGVRAGSSLVHRLLNRGIVESASFKAKDAPELKLAAGCLHAYMFNQASLEKALADYKPNKALFSNEFLTKVMDLGVAYAEHSRDIAEKELASAEQAFQDSVGAVRRSAAGQTEANAAAQNHPAVTDALVMTHFAKERHASAEWLSGALRAVKELLVADEKSATEAEPKKTEGAGTTTSTVTPEKKQRLLDAMGFFLKDISLDLHKYQIAGYGLSESAAKPIEDAIRTNGAALAVGTFMADNGLVLQNLLGTYAAKFGWDALEQLLIAGVEGQKSRFENLFPKEQAWLAQAVPQALAKLTYAHMEMYLQSENFDKQNYSAYNTLATALHDNAGFMLGNSQSWLVMPTLVAFTSTVTTNLADQAKSNVRYLLGDTAYDVAAQAASSAWTGAATGITAGVNMASESTLLRAIQDTTVSVSVATANYAANAWSTFTSTALGFVDAFKPASAPYPTMLA